MVIVVQLDAGADRYGFPRRCYVVMDERYNVLDVVEGGEAALRRDWPQIGRACPPSFQTTFAQYQRLVAMRRPKLSRRRTVVR